MDESSLAAMFEQAVAARPPTPDLITNALQTGRKLRMRHHIKVAIASIAGIGIVAAVAPTAFGALNHPAPAPATGRRAPETLFVADHDGTVTPIRVAATSAGRPIQINTVPGGASPMATAANGRVVYVSSGSGTVTPITTTTGNAGAPIQATRALLSDLVVTPDGRKAYAIANSSGIVPVNLVTRRPGRLIRDFYAEQLTMTPNGATLYVADRLAGVIPIRTATATKLRPIPHTTYVLAMAKNGKTVYLTCVPFASITCSNSGGSIIPVSTATNRARKAIQVQGRILQLVIAASGRIAYALTASAVNGQQFEPARVIPVNLATGAVGTAIRIPSTQIPSAIAITPDGKTLYIASGQAQGDGHRAFITPVSTAANTLLKRISYADEAVSFLTVTPDGSMAYFGLGPDVSKGTKNYVVGIRTATNKAQEPIPVAGGSVAEIVTP
jgi:DNA-binding beta-propeller fold protein YncE